MGAPTNNFAVDITKTIEQKIAALRAHVSQVSANFEETEKRVRAWAADNGKKYELEYAEVFHKVDNP